MQNVVTAAEGGVRFEEGPDRRGRGGGCGLGRGGEDGRRLRVRGVAGLGLLLERAEGAQGGFLLQVESLQALGGAVAEGGGGDARDVGDGYARGCERGEGGEGGGEGGEGWGVRFFGGWRAGEGGGGEVHVLDEGGFGGA